MINKQEAIDAIEVYRRNTKHILGEDNEIVKAIKTCEMLVQEVEETEKWIPCSKRLPESIRPVIVTWKNTDPASYYQYIVGKHFTGTACYKNGKWYWYSSTTEDMLAEYGRYDSEDFDEAIECVAWMPLPEVYKENENGTGSL